MERKQVSVTDTETSCGVLRIGHFRSSSAAPRHRSNLRGSALDPRTSGPSSLALIWSLVPHSATHSRAPFGAQSGRLHA